MKNRTMAAMLLTLALTFGASQSALADCDLNFETGLDNAATADLKYLCGTILGADFLMPRKQYERDLKSLTSKSGEANVKAYKGRAADAVKKVNDIIKKVRVLQDPASWGKGSKVKIDYDNAEDILDAAGSAIRCIKDTSACL